MLIRFQQYLVQLLARVVSRAGLIHFLLQGRHHVLATPDISLVEQVV